MRIAWLAAICFLSGLTLTGCSSPETGRTTEGNEDVRATFTGTWITDGTGAGGIRTFFQEGPNLTGHFDEGRGRYDGTVKDRSLSGRFWWNDDAEHKIAFDQTPADQRGSFEITLSRNGQAFTGRSKYETGQWTSWNGLKTNIPAGPEEELPLWDYSGVWATDGTGAGGVRTIMQVGNSLTGHFDNEKGRFDGVVKGFRLVGRFWWNEGDSAGAPFEDTPPGQRGFFEVAQSSDGNAFTGRSKYETGEWEPWNGFRTGLMPESGAVPPVADFTGTWATDGTGAEGIRTMAQEDNRLTGSFDGGRGHYSGEVKGWFLVGRFWWTENPADKTPFEKIPADRRGYFEVTQSPDREAFTGKSRFENGDWEPWNGIRFE